MSGKFLPLLGCALVLLAHPANAAIVFGQVDDFQGGLSGWTNGALSVIGFATGGPGGSGDAYIRVASNGNPGAGGRLVAFNRDQWVNDASAPSLNYLAQGVTAIEIDLNNQNAVQLSIRLAFKSTTDFGASGYLSAPVILAANSGWKHFTISIAAADLVAIGGPEAYTTFFSGPFGEMRLINEVGATNLNGDFVAAHLGIDNVRAVPEPTATALAVSGLLVLGARLLRRTRRSLQS